MGVEVVAEYGAEEGEFGDFPTIAEVGDRGLVGVEALG